VELHPFERARTEIFDEDVRLRDQLVEHRATLRFLEIERDAFFIPVNTQVVRALAAEKRRTPRTRVVALAGLLDLDDARAEIAEQHCAIRSREHARQIENRNLVKWAHDS